MIQVRIIRALQDIDLRFNGDLEDTINKELSELSKYKIIDIKYQESIDSELQSRYSAMIIYEKD